MLFESLAYAQAAQATAPDPKLQFIPFIIVALIMYFLLIRPTQKKQKKHKQMLTQLKRGDEVWTTGGIYGIVELVEDHTINLKISENTVIKILKAQIGSPMQKAAANDTKSK